MTILKTHGQKHRSEIPAIALVQTAWHYAGKKYRKYLVAFYSLSTLSSSMIIVQTFFIGKIVNRMQEGGPALFDDLLVLFGIYVGFGLLFWVLHVPSRIMERRSAFFIKKAFIEDCYKKVTEMPAKWHQDHHSGDTIDRVNKASQGLYHFADFQSIFITDAVLFVGSVIALLLVHFTAGIIVAVTGCVIFFMLTQFDRILIRLQREQNKIEHKVTAALFDYISNIFTVITLRLERTTHEEVQRRLNRVYSPLRKSINVNEAKWFSMFLGINFLEAAVVLTYIWSQIDAGLVIQIGTAVVLYQYTKRISETFEIFAIFYYMLIQDHTNLATVDPLMNDHAALGKDKDTVRPTSWKRINLSNITFQNEDGDNRYRLKDVDICLNRGEKIALVGESGSGKSSLMTVIRGLHPVQSAHIAIDGENFESLQSLAALSTLVPQEPEIFENTVGYNVTMGLPYDKADVKQAVKMACFDTVLNELPQGLQTDIREKGVNLSGGQKQRLALARGILSAQIRSLILLDEPTSSIDPTTERQIYNNMFAHFNDRCIVSSVHRLHLLPEFDTIYVLSEGKVIETGSFASLLAKPNSALSDAWQRYLQNGPSVSPTINGNTGM